MNNSFLISFNIQQLGAELNAHAISHLEEISDEGITSMSKSKSAAVILPATAYILKFDCNYFISFGFGKVLIQKYLLNYLHLVLVFLKENAF